ncbi:MAG: hypothetical protein COA79_02480 [Planctomycetota bacterium]|nr:MAG: hypothetical protein COA79_02480 [Planctomycetota bacterium]
MKKNFYENGRMKYYQRQQIIEFDFSTLSAIAITIIFMFFCIVLLLMLNAIGYLPEVLLNQFSQKKENTSIAEEGDTQPIELSFIETPIKQTIQKVIVENKKLEEPNKPVITLNKKTSNKKIIVVNQHKEPAPPKPIQKLPAPPKKIKEIVKKEEIKEKATTSISSTTNSKEIFQVSVTKNKNESFNNSKIRLYLMAQIQEKITLYKEYVPKKWKYIGGSYIMDITLEKNKKPQRKTVSNTVNFYFNQIVERTFKSIQYPSLKKYKLEKYDEAFIITYRPLK